MSKFSKNSSINKFNNIIQNVFTNIILEEKKEAEEIIFVGEQTLIFDNNDENILFNIEEVSNEVEEVSNENILLGFEEVEINNVTNIINEIEEKIKHLN